MFDISPSSAAAARPRCLTWNHDGGPLVVDLWEPPTPTARPPVLLIHGWGAAGGYWRSTARDLSESRCVLVPDLPGTGRSQPVQRPQGLFEQSASLVRVLDELGLDRVALVGHSMGAAMALLVAERCPERVERLVLTSLCLFTSEAEKRLFRLISLGFSLSLGVRRLSFAKSRWFGNRLASRYFHRPPADPSVIDQIHRDFLALDAASAVACARGATDHAIDRAAALVRAPTLLIAGRQDDLMPIANVGYTARTIVGCQVQWVDRCGHLPMVERPGEYLGILRGFLDSPDITAS
ncbi:alpha/beta hydrolase [Thioalkalicoccus limnaeus]|uniref:Alpha/beta hydrolase n=1 Tax=Thioalkalicoccus limnaeus TaxID=120681 RepID=A0ABV4BDV8_9GAMM